MAIQTVKVSTAPNDGNGDPVRTAFQKMNENFTNKDHAASRIVGEKVGNATEAKSDLLFSSKNPTTMSGIGGSGLMSQASPRGKHTSASDTGFDDVNGFYAQPSGSIDAPAEHQSGDTAIVASWASTFNSKLFMSQYRAKGSLFFRIVSNNNHRGWNEVYGTNNTTKDSNGFLKGASPVVDLYSDHVELNAEAELQNIRLEVLGVGDYLITGSLGFAQEGWYVEQPKDANGNVLVAVVYEQLENNDISIKTFKKKFDLETASIVADLNNPTDIPEGRFISVRLQELPPEDIEAPENFEPQLTGLSEAVSKAMSEGLYDAIQ